MSRSFKMVSLLFAITLISGCNDAVESPEVTSTPEVDALRVVSEPFEVTSELPGRIEPVRVAEVRARVSGIVVSQLFREGADVKAGDLLFQIDPAPLKASLSRAKGDLIKAQAMLTEASGKAKRYEQLVSFAAISPQEFDSAKAALGSARAGVATAQADVETAKLNLEYASVRAPISGRIGRGLVTEGALVGQGEATLMARIQQLDPVYVDFTQSVSDAMAFRIAASKGEFTEQAGADLSIQFENTDLVRKGTLQFRDIAVDPGTGQVSMRGEFANADALLLPGMYVRVTVQQGVDKNAIFVPQRAIKFSDGGDATLSLINAEDKIENRAVKTGVMQDGRWQILSGLSSGDLIVVGGPADLSPGTLVKRR